MSSHWSILPALLKFYLILNLIFLFVILIIKWKAFLFLPLFYIPLILIYHYWKQNYHDLDFELIANTYVLSNSIGMIIVMIVQGILATIIGIICFGQEQFFKLYEKIQKSNFKSYKNIKHIQIDKNFGFYLFLFSLAFLMAAGIEETLKYIMIDRVKRKISINNCQTIFAYQIYAITASLGFSTMENLGYQLTAGFNSDSSLLDLFIAAIERIVFSIPIHCLCGYLIGLRVIRRDIFKQSLSVWNIMKWSIFVHGNFNFWILMNVIHNEDSSMIDLNVLLVIVTVIAACLILVRERMIVTQLQSIIVNKTFDDDSIKSSTEIQ